MPDVTSQETDAQQNEAITPDDASSAPEEQVISTTDELIDVPAAEPAANPDAPAEIEAESEGSAGASPAASADFAGSEPGVEPEGGSTDGISGEDILAAATEGGAEAPAAAELSGTSDATDAAEESAEPAPAAETAGSFEAAAAGTEAQHDPSAEATGPEAGLGDPTASDASAGGDLTPKEDTKGPELSFNSPGMANLGANGEILQHPTPAAVPTPIDPSTGKPLSDEQHELVTGGLSKGDPTPDADSVGISEAAQSAAAAQQGSGQDVSSDDAGASEITDCAAFSCTSNEGETQSQGQGHESLMLEIREVIRDEVSGISHKLKHIEQKLKQLTKH